MAINNWETNHKSTSELTSGLLNTFNPPHDLRLCSSHYLHVRAEGAEVER